jgi:hypothetical protein
VVVKRIVWSLRFTVSLLGLAWTSALLADEPPANRVVDPDDVPPPPAPRERRTVAEFDGGYAYQSLYGISITGVGVSAVVGGAVGTFLVAADFEGIRGWTADGLQTTTLSIGPLLEHRFERLRIGGGLRVGTFDVSRVTTTSPFLSMTLGIFGRASYDLASLGTSGEPTLYLLVKAGLDSVDAPLYALTGSIGLRF